MRTLAHLAWAVIFCCSSLAAQAGFQGLTYEVVATDALTTYRVYATFSSPTDELVALYGTEGAPWSFTPLDSVFQAPTGSPWGTLIPEAAVDVIDGLAEDSWFTIGSEDDGGTSTLSTVGMDAASAAFEAGEGFSVQSEAGGAIFIFPGTSLDAVAGADLKVLIGQFTMAGPAELVINIQWRPAGGLMVYDEGITLQIPEEVGCTDPEACNYDPIAIVDDGSCFLDIDGLYDCSGVCLEDADSDGVCDALEVLGCTVPEAENYSPNATEDDGSCIAEGCTDPTASNYAAWASTDDGSCYWLGCTDPAALNPNSIATVDDGSCLYPAPSYAGLNAELAEVTEGIYVHRVYALFTNPHDELVAVYGDAEHPLTLASGTLFTQDPDGIEDFGTAFDSAADLIDSWLALGSAGEDIQTVGLQPALTAFGLGLDVNLNSEAGGMWFALPDNGHGQPDTLGRVLLGQFASTGQVSIQLNLQYQAQNGSTQQVTNQSLLFPNVPSGCLDDTACNYDANATLEDGSCEYSSCLGCTDAEACNYNPDATVDDGNCIIPEEGLTCDGVCLTDSDGDGVCDDFEVPGCTLSDAENFNSNATDDDGSCVLPGCTDDSALNYNPAANSDDGGCLYEGCMDEAALNFDVMANVEGPCDYPNPGFEGLSWEAIGTDDEGNAIYRLYAAFTNPTDILTAVFGTALEPLSIASTAGFVQSPSGFGLMPTSPSSADLESDSWLTLGTDAGSDDILSVGMTTPLATFESGGDLVLNSAAGAMWFAVPPADGAPELGTPDSEGRVLLAQLVTAGQITTTLNLQYRAPNGDPIMVWGANLTFPEGLAGCMEVSACNYEPDATLEGPCEYPEPQLDCNGDCLLDADGDGICDGDEVAGCTDPEACNFDEAATDDNGSCFFATVGTDCSGNCLIDTDGDGVCEENEIVGCQDPTACNFDADATDSGYCDYPEGEFDCSGNCLNDSDGDGICDGLEIPGCLDPQACNYQSTATDEGPCYFPPAGFDCNGNCLNDANGNGICDELEPNGPCAGPDCCGDNTLWDPIGQTCIPNGPFLCGTNTVWDPISQTCIGFDDCPADLDGNGVVALADLLTFLSSFGQPCD